MITKFRIFENTFYDKVFKDNKDYLKADKLLCINNYIGELTDKFDLTIGKLYNKENIAPFYISIIDDKGQELYFSPSEILKIFSTEQNWEEYEMKQKANKYNL